MKKLLEKLDGKKSYIASVVGTGIGLAYLFDYITADQFNALALIAGSFGLVGIRNAMDKIQTNKRKGK